MAAKSRAAALTASALLLVASTPETFEVALWAEDERAATLPGVIATDAHPCGGTATVRLTRMPPFSREPAPLGTELVVEEGGEGATWSVPVDYEPLAVRGTRLLVNHYGQRLWIGTDGALARDPGAHYPAPVTVVCPAGGPFTTSEYAQCALFPDLDSGRERLIRYETACT